MDAPENSKNLEVGSSESQISQIMIQPENIERVENERQIGDKVEETVYEGENSANNLSAI